MATKRFAKGTTAAWLVAAVLVCLVLGWVSAAFSAPLPHRAPSDAGPPPSRFVEPDAAFMTDAGANRIAAP